MENRQIEKIIIRKANSIAKKDFSANYEPDCPMDLQGSITYLIIEQLDIDCLDSSEVYDFITTKLKK